MHLATPHHVFSFLSEKLHKLSWFQVLFLASFATTHGFIQSLGGTLVKSASENVKSLNPFNFLGEAFHGFGTGVANQEPIKPTIGLARHAFDKSAGTFGGGTPENNEQFKLPYGLSGYMSNAIGRLSSLNPLGSTLGNIKSLNPMSSLRMGDDRVLVDSTKFVRSGDASPVLVEPPKFVPVPLQMAAPIMHSPSYVDFN